jgi:tight adherence protein C
MIRLLLLAGVIGTIGVSLLLSRAPWFRQPNLAIRLRNHTPGLTDRRPRILGARSFRDALGPAAETVGTAVARAVGINEDLGKRLLRLHREQTPSNFRIAQVRHAVLSLLVWVAVSAVLPIPGTLIALGTIVAPLLSLLIDEQLLSTASAHRKRDLATELPMIEEHLAMLLDAGWSLGGALQRVAERSHGPASQDILRLLRSVRRGTSYRVALREWADIADLVPVERLTNILSLADQGADLGRLVADEAQLGRDERHRELLSSVERKGQQVWIPVTVASLVPGCLLLSVPFSAALSFFSN